MLKGSLIVGGTVVTVVAGSLIATSALGPGSGPTGKQIFSDASNLFDAIDFDDNRRLEEDEFAAGFEIIMKRSDLDKDGLVSWQEFYNHAVREYRPARRFVGIAQTRFSSGDYNSDGAIGSEESSHMQEHMFRLLDRNRNNVLTVDELSQSAIGLQFTR